MATPSEDVPSTKEKTKRKSTGLQYYTKQFSVNGRKQLKIKAKNEKNRKFSKINQQWIAKKNRHLLKRRQIKKKKKQEIQKNRKEDSIGCMHTCRKNESNSVPYNGKGSRRVEFIYSQKDYENGQSFYHAASKLRNFPQNEYPIDVHISESRGYVYVTHIINDPMVGDLNLRRNRFGSTLVWNEINLGHTIPFESLAFSDSLLSYDIPSFGNTAIILGHTNPIPVCMLGHTRPF
ncbi:uncharacterized protein LOC134718728 [Mytilus trossulus]|uniref:uncharacterized protein LOC134718728 n=1 Tax=Mytilus trossulus TaxID=6551 RepID=UPI003007C15F